MLTNRISSQEIVEEVKVSKGSYDLFLCWDLQSMSLQLLAAVRRFGLLQLNRQSRSRSALMYYWFMNCRLFTKRTSRGRKHFFPSFRRLLPLRTGRRGQIVWQQSPICWLWIQRLKITCVWNVSSIRFRTFLNSIQKRGPDRQRKQRNLINWNREPNMLIKALQPIRFISVIKTRYVCYLDII